MSQTLTHAPLIKQAQEPAELGEECYIGLSAARADCPGSMIHRRRTRVSARRCCSTVHRSCF